jgi:hypothetical protein
VLQTRDLGFIFVDAGNFMPEFGKAGTADQPDVSCSDNSYLHLAFCPLEGLSFTVAPWATDCELYQFAWAVTRVKSLKAPNPPQMKTHIFIKPFSEVNHEADR